MTITTMKPPTDPDAKSEILAYINDRLCEWAEWTLSDRHLGIGYPPCSLEYRLMREGHVEKTYLGFTPLPEHPAAEEMEALLVEMATQYRQMADVIYAYYLERDGYLQKSRRLGISIALFKTHLNMGRWWLAGRLSSKVPLKNRIRHLIK